VNDTNNNNELSLEPVTEASGGISVHICRRSLNEASQPAREGVDDAQLWEIGITAVRCPMMANRRILLRRQSNDHTTLVKDDGFTVFIIIKIDKYSMTIYS
jgi:hypothetical protein